MTVLGGFSRLVDEIEMILIDLMYFLRVSVITSGKDAINIIVDKISQAGRQPPREEFVI